MRAFTVGWFCWSSAGRFLAGGIGQNVGRREPVRCRAFASATTNRVPSARGTRFVSRAAQNGQFLGVHKGMRGARHDMATDPEQIMRTLSLASR